MTDDTSSSATRIGPLGRLRQAIDDRTFFVRGLVAAWVVGALGFVALHTFGVAKGLFEFFGREGFGALSFVAAPLMALLGVIGGICTVVWAVRRATDISREREPSLVRLGLWSFRVWVELGAIWILFSLVSKGFALLVAGTEGPRVFAIVYGGGLEFLTDGLLRFDVEGEFWFRLLGLMIAAGSVLVAYAVILVGHLAVDVFEILLRFLARGGNYFGPDVPNGAEGAASETPKGSEMLRFLSPLANRIDDRSLFARAALTVVRLGVWGGSLLLVYGLVRGLFAFWDGGAASVEHGLSKVVAILVPASGLLLAGLLVIWTEVSKGPLRAPDVAGGALGLAFVVLRLASELLSLVAFMGVFTLGVMVFLTGEDVFLVANGVVGDGLGIVSRSFFDLSSGGWFGSRLLGLGMLGVAFLVAIVKAFVGYVWHDGIDAILTFFSRGGGFFGRGSRRD